MGKDSQLLLYKLEVAQLKAQLHEWHAWWESGNVHVEVEQHTPPVYWFDPLKVEVERDYDAEKGREFSNENDLGQAGRDKQGRNYSDDEGWIEQEGGHAEKRHWEDSSGQSKWAALAEGALTSVAAERLDEPRRFTERRQLIRRRWTGWAYELGVIHRAREEEEERARSRRSRACSFRSWSTASEVSLNKLEVVDRCIVKLGIALRPVLLQLRRGSTSLDEVDDAIADQLAAIEHLWHTEDLSIFGEIPFLSQQAAVILRRLGVEVQS